MRKYSAATRRIRAETCLMRISHAPDLGRTLKIPLKVPTKIRRDPTPREKTKSKLTPKRTFCLSETMVRSPARKGEVQGPTISPEVTPKTKTAHRLRGR